MGYPTKNLLWTIGGPEAGTGGIAVTRTHVIPIRDIPGLTKRSTRVEDPVLAGGRMAVKEIPTKLDVTGPLPLAPRVGGGWGKLIKSLAGTEVAPVQIGAVIRIKYTGASASCKLIADTAANTLVSKIGVIGAEANDAAFGTAGSIDLTAVPTDTVAELVALIDGYATYECVLVDGDPANVSGDIVNITTQAAGRFAFIWFTKATGGAYQRIFTADLTNTEHPVYSIEGEGYVTPYLYDGCQTASMKLSSALGGFLNADVDIIGYKELEGAGASGLTIANLDPGDPLVFSSGNTEFAGAAYPYIANFDLTIDNQNDKEGFGQGALTRQYHRKGALKITGSMQVVLDATVSALRADVFASTFRTMALTFKGKLISATMHELYIIELPSVMVSDPYDFVDRGGALDVKLNFKAFNPGGTKWDIPLKMHMVSPDVAAF